MTKDPLTDLYEDLPPSVLAELRAFVCSAGKDADQFLERCKQRDTDSQKPSTLKTRAG